MVSAGDVTASLNGPPPSASTATAPVRVDTTHSRQGAPAGTLIGGLLGWAEHLRRVGCARHPHLRDGGRLRLRRARTSRSTDSPGLARVGARAGVGRRGAPHRWWVRAHHARDPTRPRPTPL